MADRTRQGVTLLIVTAVCFLAAKVKFMGADTAEQVTVMWPPTGIELAATLMLGWRVWPAIVAGSLLADINAHEPFLTCLGIAAGNAVGAVSCAWVLHRFAAFSTRLDHVRDVLGLILLGAILNPLISAAIGAVSICLVGTQPWSCFKLLWSIWGMGGAASVFVLTPVILVWGSPPYAWPKGRRLAETIALSAGVLLVCLNILNRTALLSMGERPFLVPVFPFIIWAALRFGQRGASLAVLASVLTAVFVTVPQFGPIDIMTVGASLIPLQIIIVIISTTGLLLSAAITERGQAEKQLQNYTRELERSNRELDDFSHIVSHDLKEPLRGLQNFSQFLLEDCEDVLNEEAKWKLHAIHDLARRLGEHLDALLHYSKLGRTILAVRPTDLNEVVQKAIKFFAINLQQANATVEITRKLPVIVCDHVKITEVFQNLIGNAIKYCDKEGNQIEVGYTLEHPRRLKTRVFYVRDRGIGIPGKQLEVIFNMFKRLHLKNEYGGGTGSGLAIVRRIINQHGGEIWAESQGGDKGTTFFFTLPQR